MARPYNSWTAGWGRDLNISPNSPWWVCVLAVREQLTGLHLEHQLCIHVGCPRWHGPTPTDAPTHYRQVVTTKTRVINITYSQDIGIGCDRYAIETYTPSKYWSRIELGSSLYTEIQNVLTTFSYMGIELWISEIIFEKKHQWSGISQTINPH